MTYPRIMGTFESYGTFYLSITNPADKSVEILRFRSAQERDHYASLYYRKGDTLDTASIRDR